MRKASMLVLGFGSVGFALAAYFTGYTGDLLALMWGPIAFVTGYLAAKFF